MSIYFQKQTSENKDTTNSNQHWIQNHDWVQFANKDLPAIETRILKLEAQIATGLKKCNDIKKVEE